MRLTNRGWSFSDFPNAPFRLNKRSLQAANLMSWWPLNGYWLKGNRAIDLSGRSYHMPECPTVVTFPGSSSSKRGQVVTFAGNDAWGEHFGQR